MPRIRLRVHEEDQPKRPYRVRDPRNSATDVQTLPVLRLTTSIRIQPLPETNATPFPLLLPALIDTGAWISVIEQETWAPLAAAGLLEWLPFEDGKPRKTGFSGGGFSYRVGRVWVSLHDLQGPKRPLGTPPEIVLPAVPVIAQMLLDTECKLPFPIVLGLYLGILDGRKLTREVVVGQLGPLSTDRGRQYGQEWYLE